MTNTIKGFFFDLDGTLVNTHESNFRAYQQAINEVVGAEVGEELKERIKRGESSDDFLPGVLDSVTDDQVRDIQQKKKQAYPDHLHVSELNEFLSSFLEHMSKDHVTALVTTAKRKNAEAVIKAHDIEKYFDFCIYGDDVSEMKPNSEGYLLALERAKLQPDEVIAFEDSDKGMQAALGAGIRAILIRSFHDA